MEAVLVISIAILALTLTGFTVQAIIGREVLRPARRGRPAGRVRLEGVGMTVLPAGGLLLLTGNSGWGMVLLWAGLCITFMISSAARPKTSGRTRR